MKKRDQIGDVFDAEEVDSVLKSTFYKRDAGRPRTKKKKTSKADHYDVICISLYKEDLGRLDTMVGKLKKSGHRKMSRSALIRFALDQVDLKKLPRAY